MRFLPNWSFKSIMLRMLLSATFIIATSYVLLCVYLYVAQQRYVFFPDDYEYGTPGNAGLKWNDVFLTTSDDIKIHAWCTYADDPQGWVLVCHGNGGNITYLVSLIDYMAKEHHLNSLVFDYRGYGKSEGVPSEKGLYTDAQTAYEYLLNILSVPPSKIILYGHSLGGGVATELATRVKCAGIVLESTFTSLPDLAQHIYPYLPARFLSRYSFNSKKKIVQLTIPKMIVHGVMDQVIPFEMGQALYSAAGEPKRFVETPGYHNESDFLSWPPYNEAWKKLLIDAGFAKENARPGK